MLRGIYSPPDSDAINLAIARAYGATPHEERMLILAAALPRLTPTAQQEVRAALTGDEAAKERVLTVLGGEAEKVPPAAPDLRDAVRACAAASGILIGICWRS